MKNSWPFLLALAAAALLPIFSKAQDPEPYELPPVNYSASRPRDAITHLQGLLAAGDLQLKGNDRAIVATLLKELHIPIASQLLVFSKTSFQNDRIGPEHPRALYFTDNCYVGWVPGGLMEVAAMDPLLGPVFYSFDPRNPARGKTPEFTRDNDCLRCHGGAFVSGIPAVFARSLFADKEGEPIYRQGTQVVDFRTPFAERWGGWYVTGTHGKMQHRGNAFASENGLKLVFNPAPGANATNLARFFDAGDYLTNSSDIVALLVFEHQTTVQNAITRAGLNCRRMLDYQNRLQKELQPSAPTNEEPSFDSVRGVFDHSAQEVVDALLSKDEAELPDNLAGSAAFQGAFMAGCPRAPDGSSLKELWLSDHLFKNRCSYLIYSDSFLALPRPLRQRIHARLTKALSAEEPDPRYSYIHRAERQRIANILRSTSAEFGRYQ